MALTISLTEEDCRNCSWELVEQTDTYRRYIGRGTHPVTGQDITVQKTEFLGEEALLARNGEERNEAGRWSSGSGSDRGGHVPMVKVASVPLNKFFADIAPQMKAGDEDHLKWWLNREQNEPFRTRRGRV